MKYHAFFVIFEESSKIGNCCLLQSEGGALRVNVAATIMSTLIMETTPRTPLEWNIGPFTLRHIRIFSFLYLIKADQYCLLY